MHSHIVGTVLVATIVLSGTALAAQDAGKDSGNGKAQMRFKGMDRNGDGRITRAEWHGNGQSFKEHDWNGDGVLSGQEVREGAKRQGRSKERADEDRDDRFQDWDDNRDGRIARSEWRGTAERFGVLDQDRNGFLTENEAEGTEPPTDRFSSVDVNRDGSIARREWQGSQPSFDQRDSNRDGRLSRDEFAASSSPSRSPSRSPSVASSTSSAGYERGVADGRQAGREDGARNRWDLDGQRELEQADAGYHAGLGPRAEYQAGYREGFRQAYREGFGR